MSELISDLECILIELDEVKDGLTIFGDSIENDGYVLPDNPAFNVIAINFAKRFPMYVSLLHILKNKLDTVSTKYRDRLYEEIEKNAKTKAK